MVWVQVDRVAFFSREFAGILRLLIAFLFLIRVRGYISSFRRFLFGVRSLVCLAFVFVFQFCFFNLSGGFVGKEHFSKQIALFLIFASVGGVRPSTKHLFM